MTTFEVRAAWDSETSVWVAQSDDLPGLVAKAATWDDLRNKLILLGLELIEQHNLPLDEEGGQIHLVTEDRIPLEWC